MLIGGPVGGIPVGGIPVGGRPIPAGVRLGTLNPTGAMRAANGSEASAEGVAAGAGVEGAVIAIVGGGGGALAFANSAGSSWPSTYHTLNCQNVQVMQVLRTRLVSDPKKSSSEMQAKANK